MIANIDENTGKLEQMLIEQGLRDNTIVIFLTDNGTTTAMNIQCGHEGQEDCFMRADTAYPSLSAARGRPAQSREISELAEAQDDCPR
jgi:arylsulfatase A-like enzyme